MIKENNLYDPEEYKFETLGELKIYLYSGANLGFKFHNKEYGIEGHDNKYDIWIYEEGDIARDLSLDQVLDFKIQGERIKDIVLNAEITERLWK